jgi:hypothetical protein
MIDDLPVKKSVRPPGWCVLTLNQLADVVGGGTPDTGESVYWNPSKIPWVTPTDTTACPGPVLTKTEWGICEAGLRDLSTTLLPVGTSLLTSRATVGECKLGVSFEEASTVSGDARTLRIPHLPIHRRRTGSSSWAVPIGVDCWLSCTRSVATIQYPRHERAARQPARTKEL